MDYEGTEMSNVRLSMPIVAFAATIFFYGTAALAKEVVCESNAGKTSVKIEFKADTLLRSGEKIEVTPACSQEVMTIKKCAVVEVQKKGRQKYCFPEGRPAYFDIYDVIEYYVE
jgi:hypothetical protein